LPRFYGGLSICWMGPHVFGPVLPLAGARRMKCFESGAVLGNPGGSKSRCQYGLQAAREFRILAENLQRKGAELEAAIQRARLKDTRSNL
jgi:hypothetical protein